RHRKHLGPARTLGQNTRQHRLGRHRSCRPQSPQHRRHAPRDQTAGRTNTPALTPPRWPATLDTPGDIMSTVVDSDNAAASDTRFEIEMLHDRVLIRQSEEEGERRSSGGIVIPATAEVAQRLAWGEALGIGNNVRHVKVGARVLYNPAD